jgi:hypothetical protein
MVPRLVGEHRRNRTKRRRFAWLWVLPVLWAAAATFGITRWYAATTGPHCTATPNTPSDLVPWILVGAVGAVTALTGVGFRQSWLTVVLQTLFGLAVAGVLIFLGIVLGAAGALCLN